MFVEYVSLKPNLSIECGSDSQGVAAQGALVDEHFELDAFEIEVNPEELASGKWVSQRFESDHAARQTPIILMRCAGGRGFFEWHPPRLRLSSPHARAIRQTTKTDVQLLSAKPRW